MLEDRHLLNGVTIITHGYESDGKRPVWLDYMEYEIATRIADANNGSLNEVAQFTMTITGALTPQVSGWTFGANFPRPGENPKDFDLKNSLGAEAIIMLDWSACSSNLVSTQSVAEVVADYLQGSDLGNLGKQLLASPIHLIGHSRGASLMGAFAEDLAEAGIWVDQITHLDTHPLAVPPDWHNSDFGVPGNVVYADSYWRDDLNPADFNGETVPGAYDKELDFGYYNEYVADVWPLDTAGYTLEHSDVHLWYHGTIDTDRLISDGEVNSFDPDDAGWYSPTNLEPRDEVGYYFSRVVGGPRRLVGISRALGGDGGRLSVATSAAVWPNLLQFRLESWQRQFAQGDLFRALYYYQDCDSNAWGRYYLDQDRNPYNENEFLVSDPAGRFLAKTGESPWTDGYIYDTAKVSPGIYYVMANIGDSSGHTRYVYEHDSVTIDNVRPDITDLEVHPSPVDEDGSVALSGTFTDPGVNDIHTIVIDWGDGTQPDQFVLPVRQRSFSGDHTYKDDNPSGTKQDGYTITVSVSDNWGGTDSDVLPVSVRNVAPDIVGLSLDRDRINENNSVALSGTFTDPGTEDTHRVVVNWGDGTSDSRDLPKGARSFSISKSQPYLDDNPSATSEDDYPITVTMRDDDTGSDSETTTVTVVNVAPEIVKNFYEVNEGGSVSFGDCYTDPGTQDTHTVSPPSRSFPDDDPTGTLWDDYHIPVTVTDDDTGADTEDIVVRVYNVAPHVNLPETGEIDEGSLFVYPGSFIDPGTDTWQGWVDYGDGAGWEDLPLDGKSFRLEHDYYHDDGQYTVKVRVRDDDTGEHTAEMLLTVENVAPTVSIEGPRSVNEGTLWRGTVSFVDPGRDTWTVTIDWGDGSEREISPIFDKAFTIEHIYADDGTYPLEVTITDDDRDSGTAQWPVAVRDVGPSLWIRGMRTVDEGTELSVTDIGMFTDPGFDNPANPFHQPGGSRETFFGHVNWGDLSPQSDVPGTVDFPGGPGKLTRGTFDGKHTFADNDPLTNDRFYARLWATDDDGGQSTPYREMTIVVNNVAPKDLQVTLAATEINEGDTAHLTVSFVDPGLLDHHRARIDWGDGTGIEEFDILPVGARTFPRDHRYEDDNPSGTPSDPYTITVTVLDDDGGVSPPATAGIRVNNVPPTVTANATSPASEGAVVMLTVNVTDPGSRDTFLVDVNWGDGTSEPPPVLSPNTNYTFTHVYADNGAYPVGVRVTDDDTGVGQVNVPLTIFNAPPVITSITLAPQPTPEGAVVTLTAAFNDKGTLDTHTAEIDWGDNDQMTGVVVETPFGPPGSVDGMTGTVTGSHVYADNGTYRVKLTVWDDNDDSHFLFADVVVTNVSPTLSVPGSQTVDEGQSLELVSTFTDPGFSKPSVGTTETFFYRIEWGDGAVNEGPVTDVQNGQPGTPTRGTFVGRHVYADNGAYPPVRVLVRDDDMPAGTWVERTVAVTVRNVAPTVVLVGPGSVGSVTGDEGAQLVFDPIATFTDPGFTNPLAGTVETFSYRIDWGDGKFDDWRPVTDVQQGRPGVPTQGSFAGSHIYADNDTYPVRVAVKDDDGGEGFQTFQAIISNVAPTLWIAGNQSVDLGTPLTVEDLGVFSDPGFDNPLATPPTRETFSYRIDWGDNTPASTGTATIDTAGGPGSPTWGSFDGTHLYGASGVFVVTVRVTDDDTGHEEQQFEVIVSGAGGFQFLTYQEEASTPTLGWNSGGLLPLAQAAGSLSGPMPSVRALQAAAENVAPTLWVIGNQQFDESPVSIVDIGTFHDADSAGPFAYRIDWGDGTPVDTGTAAIDVAGPPTYGSFNGQHAYRRAGSYVVGVTITDNEGGFSTEECEVAVRNVPPTASIAGVVFVDFDGHGLWDAVEPKLPGVPITIEGTGSRAGFSQSTTTADDGSYHFQDLPVGTYQVTETHPRACLPGGPDSVIVTVESGKDLVVDFWDRGFRPECVSKQFMLTRVMPVGSPAWRQLVREILSRAEQVVGQTSLPASTPKTTAAAVAPVAAQAIIVAPDPVPVGNSAPAAVSTPTSNVTLAAANSSSAPAVSSGQQSNVSVQATTPVAQQPGATAVDQTAGASTKTTPVTPPESASASPQTPKAASDSRQQVTQQEIQPILDEAVARWSAAGLDPQLVKNMRHTEVVVAVLPGLYLGMADRNVLYIDQDAAGRGWFVDSTPAVDEEFRLMGSDAALRAVEPRAVDRMDLLTVVSHELGHLAGLADIDSLAGSLISRSLGQGVRRVAGTREIDALFGGALGRNIWEG